MGDAAIRDTDNDAAVSRLSAVNAGYLHDPFAQYFVKRSQSRPPLINIGTFLRTWAIDELVNQFLDASGPEGAQKKQILSVGAGTDTRFFRIQQAGGSRAASVHKYVEVDFPEATTKKAMVIKKQSALADLLTKVRLEQGGSCLTSDKYALLAGDLRDFAQDLSSKLANILDPTLPTLVLAECVFIYLEPKHSQSILQWHVDTFRAGAMCISYDPVSLDDAFGKVMINNLKARALHLHGLEANASLQVQQERLQRIGFHHATVRTVAEIRSQDLPADESQRISRLEMLDEVEELNLLLSHYSIVWACTSPLSLPALRSLASEPALSEQTETP